MARADAERHAEQDGTRPVCGEDDPRYRRARAAYLRLLSEGRLRCGSTCPLSAIGQCTARCW